MNLLVLSQTLHLQTDQIGELWFVTQWRVLQRVVYVQDSVLR